jgi:hypothetical protein
MDIRMAYARALEHGDGTRKAGRCNGRSGRFNERKEQRWDLTRKSVAAPSVQSFYSCSSSSANVA